MPAFDDTTVSPSEDLALLGIGLDGEWRAYIAIRSRNRWRAAALVLLACLVVLAVAL